MKRLSAVLVLSALAALSGGISPAAASNSPNVGCGKGFTLTTDSAFAGQLASWFSDLSSDPSLWLATIQAAWDDDADGMVCFHSVGKIDPVTGHPYLVVGDNSANANTTPA
jgi:hypothetical protein